MGEISQAPVFINPQQQLINLGGATVGELIGVVSTGPVKLGLVAAPAAGGGIGSSINYAPAAGADDPGTGVTGFVATAGSGGTGRVKITLAGNTTFASWPAGADGQQLFLTIVAGNFFLTLTHLASAPAGKKFLASQDLSYALNDTAQLLYDSGLAQWLVIA